MRLVYTSWLSRHRCYQCSYHKIMGQAQEIARILLEKQAVTLNTKEPYTYASGIRSPIYCDNRRMIFFPRERALIAEAFAEQIAPFNPDIIAGTASGAIAWASWAAEKLAKPMVYIRKASKGYGRQQLIEGGEIAGKTVVVIEDLVSTGGSSLSAVSACRDAGAEVLAMVAIFTYEFTDVALKFDEIGCQLRFLSNFSTLIQVAAADRFIAQEQLSLIREWNQDPHTWGPKHGFPNAETKNS
jgi:orotate phosphoribosyltransferase